MKNICVNSASNMPRTDYPRPQWVRENWHCLNGEWDFAFDFGNSGEERGMVHDDNYPMKILVPFCPESKLSGIVYKDFMSAVWYSRIVNISELPAGRCILHFGAVDYFCKVWVNGELCGTHKGGYTAFEMDITKALRCGDNRIVVCAQDDQRSGRQVKGKQCDAYQSYACAYTRTTGIHQTVWLEFVPEKYLEKAKMTPHAVDGALDIQISVKNVKPGDFVRITTKYHGNKVAENEANISYHLASTRITVDEIHLWQPGRPELYDMTIELIDGETKKTIDTVESYFALRDIALTKRALTVNGTPVFMRMILDQGFHPEGVYTAPNDERLKRDIESAMELGFNGARFHYRIFEERSMYWADRLGYLVWAEYPLRDLSGPRGFCDYLPEWTEVINQYYNHPSVIGWICANETYHRMELDPMVEKLSYHITKALDPFRPVIDASGGVHYETDMFDVHNYEQEPESLLADLKTMDEDDTIVHSPVFRYRGNAPIREETYVGQPYWVSECGGMFWKAVHETTEGWGYGEVPDEDSFAKRYEGLIQVMLSHPRVCGFCYTQLTDIEQEQNGLYAYDRSPKFSHEIYDRIRAANLQIAEIEK